MLNKLAKIRTYILDSNFELEKFDLALSFLEERGDEGQLHFALKVLDALLEFRPDQDTVLSILLADLFFYDVCSAAEVSEKFGVAVFELLNSLKKISSLSYLKQAKNSQIESLRKMFLTMAKDIRVVIVVLTMRLCRLELCEGRDAVIDLAQETMNVYVPIASRLGIYRLKTKLEDLCFKYLEPEAFDRISAQVEEIGVKKKKSIDKMIEQIGDFLDDKGVEANVLGRIKSIYSIYSKLKRKDLDSLDQLYDFFAIRIVLPDAKDGKSVDNLYAVLGLIHGRWTPISSRFKDYIAVPKPNGYSSLHTVVLGLAPKEIDQPVEIQIRDMSMHRDSEYGVASHWLYKTVGSDGKINSTVDWIKGLEQINDFFANDAEFLQGVNLDIFKDRIFVLTPRGDVKDLPAGSIPIDFAYAVHTDVGNSCVLAKVNSMVVPLDYELKNGDVVEIVTKKDSKPKLRWLSQVKSNFASSRIKAWFSALNREDNIKEGKRLMNVKLEELSLPVLDRHYMILKNVDGRDLNINQRESLLEEIGKGFKLASNIVRKIFPDDFKKEKLEDVDPESFNSDLSDILESDDVVIGGESGLPTKLAACCGPIFGDNIVAYVNRGNSVTVHKDSCSLLDDLAGERIIIANWKALENDNHDKYHHKSVLEVKVLSRLGLIRDITGVIAELNVRIVDVDIKPVGAGVFLDVFVVEFEQEDILELLMEKIEGIKGVLAVKEV